MRRLILGCALAAALLAPVTASAKPTKADKTNAAKQCRAEREAIGVEAFRAEYGSNKNGKNAFGKCVSQKAKERKKARENAAKACKAEREASGVEAFRAEYGSNKNGKNAFGKCVSQKVKEDSEEEPS